MTCYDFEFSLTFGYQVHWSDADISNIRYGYSTARTAPVGAATVRMVPDTVAELASYGPADDSLSSENTRKSRCRGPSALN